MIVGFIGDRGCGKTLVMTLEAFNKYKNGVQIYSNYKLNFPILPNTKKPKPLPKDFFVNFENYKLSNTSIFLDEIHTLVDSRCSGKLKNRLMSYFFNQTRKTGVDLYFTTQFFSQVDKRLRFNTERFVLPKSFRLKDGTIIIVYEVCNRDMKLLRKFRLKANCLFSLYDTNEIIKE